MGLELMKARMGVSGKTYRDEALRDAILIDVEENENDISYCDTFYKCINQDAYDDDNSFVQYHPRLYARKSSAYRNHEMKFKTTINEPVKYGDVFHDKEDGSWWFCIQVDLVDDVHYIGKVLECNYLLYWQRDNGEIISRYCHIFNASSYSNGETEGRVITLPSNQFMVYMTFDDITDELENGKRMHISKSNRRCKAYELTRADDITYGYGGFDIDGILNIIFTQNRYDPDKDKLITLEDSGKEVWICNYIDPDSDDDTTTPSNPTQPTIPQQSLISSKISYKGKAELKSGGNAKTFTGELYDSKENLLSDIGVWEVITIDELKPYITYEIDDNKLKIKVSDDNAIIGGKIRIMFSDKKNTTSSYVDIDVVSII